MTKTETPLVRQATKITTPLKPQRKFRRRMPNMRKQKSNKIWVVWLFKDSDTICADNQIGPVFSSKIRAENYMKNFKYNGRETMYYAIVKREVW